MMMSASANAPEGAKAEPNLDKMTKKVQHLHKSKRFYEQIEFNSEQKLAITKSIIKLTDPIESCQLVERRSRRRSRFDDAAVVFYDNDRQPSNHPQSTTLYNSEREWSWAQESYARHGSSINIIFLSTLDAVGIMRGKIIRQPIEVSNFIGNRTFTIDFVNLDLTVGLIQVAHPFQVIDSQQATTWYFVSLGSIVIRL